MSRAKRNYKAKDAFKKFMDGKGYDYFPPDLDDCFEAACRAAFIAGIRYERNRQRRS